MILNLLDLYVKIMKDKWTVEDACPYGVGDDGEERRVKSEE